MTRRAQTDLLDAAMRLIVIVAALAATAMILHLRPGGDALAAPSLESSALKQVLHLEYSPGVAAPNDAEGLECCIEVGERGVGQAAIDLAVRTTPSSLGPFAFRRYAEDAAVPGWLVPASALSRRIFPLYLSTARILR